MATQYMHQRRVSQQMTYETHRREKTGEQHCLLSNFFNLPLINIKNQQTTVAMPQQMKLKVIPFMAERFGYSEIFDNENASSPQKLLSVQQRCREDECGILSKYIRNKKIEINRWEQEDFKIKKIEENANQSIDSIDRELYRKKLGRNVQSNIRQLRANTIQVTTHCKTYESNDDTELKPKNSILKNQKILLPKEGPQNMISLKEATNMLEMTLPLKENQKINQRLKRNKKSHNSSPLYRKFVIIIVFVRAALRISKSYRKVINIQQEEYQALQKLKEPHQQYVDMFGFKYVKGQQRNYVNIVSNKILHYFGEKKYISECQSIWNQTSEYHQDLRRTRFCSLALMFLQNLEFLTRGNNLPILIKHQLNICLFQQKNEQISQFVAKRCNIYSEKVRKLNSNDKLMIASEYFLFEVIAPNLICQGNELETQSLAHKNQTLFFCVGILSLLQIRFIRHFSKIRKIQNSSIKPIQKSINLKTDQQTGIMTGEIEINQKLEEDETIIIAGCFKNETIITIEKQRPTWSEQHKALFTQIISNLQSHIDL